MKHASDLKLRTLCGSLLRELPKGDRVLAALTDITQAMVDCPICREKLGLEKMN